MLKQIPTEIVLWVVQSRDYRFSLRDEPTAIVSSTGNAGKFR